MAVVYEVSVSVPSESNETYAEYMTNTHIPEILKTGKFFDIQMNIFEEVGHDLLNMAREPEWVHYKTCYYAHSAEDIKEYLEKYAPALREDFLKHCPKDAKISRRVWTLAKRWNL